MLYLASLIITSLCMSMQAQPVGTPVLDDQEVACSKESERCICEGGLAVGTCERTVSGTLKCLCCRQQGDPCSCGAQTGTCDYVALACTCDQDAQDDVPANQDQTPSNASGDDGGDDDDDEKEGKESSGQNDAGEKTIEKPEPIVR